MTRIFTIIGARPQFIKAAAVSRRISVDPRLQESLVHTGQHYDTNMSDVFFKEMGIPKPAHHLGIAGGGHGDMTGRMLMALEELFLAERPDLVMIYGDTNSTLAGALAAAKLHIPVVHVEAGLRSFNRRMPEEVNRILADQCSDLLFTPTAAATANLLREGITATKIVECGDVMFDASLHFSQKAIEGGNGAARFGMKTSGYVLATVHRQENTDDLARLTAIIDGLSQVATELPVLLPLHPRTRARAEAAALGDKLATITVIEPVGYLDMVGLEKDAAVIATDSGGVQKEAFFHKIPCVTLRDETEWVELVESGWNMLVPPTSAKVIRDAILQARGRQGRDIAPYGGGDAAGMIVDRLREYTS
ncbi:MULTISPECIES: non-hydrolyzing UDP-N-acetylglucosamine 2-epimerase [unclassified Yoonia]|uniref:non-hydrolyzing UDP-N-acetylglucosamine 2-epimerase n=1 Tax=unclassified Yoonia TaxID=2629118 RepID=UPI002AFE9253|nr:MULTISPECIES: UDP-N-acetylglucosamine 2-epimerase (non-hydrolyzing) [unclassified Yoonia]